MSWINGLNTASHKRDKIRFIQAVQFSFGDKTVLTRIISIVRVPSLYPNKDNTINRDDDAKRSPLSAKHVADFVFQGNRSAAIDDRSFSSFSEDLEEVIAFWAVDFLLSSWKIHFLLARFVFLLFSVRV